VLALVLAVALTVEAAADTSVRVPGTSLRFGFTAERLHREGEFAVATSKGAAGAAAGGLTGKLRFFGVDGQATLHLDGGALTRVHLEMKDAPGQSLDYIQDQLLRSGLERRCQEFAPGRHLCDWIGPATVHLEIIGSDLTAEITRAVARVAPVPAPIHAPPADTARARMSPPAPGPAAGAGAAAAPDTIHFGSAEAAAIARPAVADSCRPARPAAARAQGVFGRVLVTVLVDTTGSVLDARVTRSVRGLDQAALECARRYRFVPLRVDGRTVRFTREIPIRFLLD